MQLDRLINFIEAYAQDFLEDGTKKKIIKELQQGNLTLAAEITEVIDKEWVERTKEVNKFYIFTDIRPFDDKGNVLEKPYYKTNYIDSMSRNDKKIPTLRRVQSMEIGALWYDDSMDFER